MASPGRLGRSTPSKEPHLLEAVEMFTDAQHMPAIDYPMLSFQSDRTTLHLSPHIFIHLDPGIINRSELLTGICEAAEVPGDARVPVPASCLQRWLIHVFPGVKTQKPDERDEIVHTKRQRMVFGKHLGALGSGEDDFNNDSEIGPRAKQRLLNADALAGKRLQAEYLTHAHSCKVQKVVHSQRDVEHACSLLQAADLLVDEQTKVEARKELASFLRHEIEDEAIFGRAQHRPATEAVACLSDDLTVQMLAAANLPLGHLLDHFPSTTGRLLALRAHHPSIERSATLRLSASNPAPLHLLLPVITTLTHLRTLSLASHTFPEFPAAPDFGTYGNDASCDPGAALVRVLTALPLLTHLSLRDTVLTNALGALMLCPPSAQPPVPPLPNLLSLDLGHNNLDSHMYIPNRRGGGGSCGGRGWSVAQLFKSATNLRAVDLNKSLNTACAILRLTGVLRHLPQLERLAVGAGRELFTGCGTCPAKRSHVLLRPDGCTAVAVLRLALTLCRIDSLRSLTFDFTVYPMTPEVDKVHDMARAAVGRAVGSLEQLEHLSIGNSFCNCTPGPEHEVEEEEEGEDAQAVAAITQAVQDVLTAHDRELVPLAAGLAALTRLTSLDMRPAVSLCSAGTIVLARSLQHAPALRELRLPYVVLSVECCNALLETVWRLSALTAFEVHNANSVNGAHSDSLTAFMHALETISHLREIRGPALVSPSPADGAADDESADDAAGDAVEWPATGALAEGTGVVTGPGKAVELDAEVLDHGLQEPAEGAANGGLGMPAPKFSNRLRHVSSLRMVFIRPENIHGRSAVARSLQHMPQLTRLEFGLNIRTAVPLRHGLAVFELLQLATSLQSLTVWPVAPRSGAKKRAGNMAAAMCDSLCVELPKLRCLTSLRLAVTPEDLWFIGNVLKRCEQLHGLQRLRLVVHDWGVNPPPAPGKKKGFMFWNVEALTGLRSLEIDTGGQVDISGRFLRGLSRLTELRRLHLHARMCVSRVKQLGWITQEYLPSLLWLAVDSHTLSDELVLQLQSLVPSRVRFIANPDASDIASSAMRFSADF